MLKFLIYSSLISIVISETCKDLMIECIDRKNECDSDITKLNCPLTCGVCKPDPNVCDDYNEDCHPNNSHYNARKLVEYVVVQQHLGRQQYL
uniref:ShKT domain-containing protein n=1 Tax=Caenorhabditis tropicalis TaxID=1561998 RepID=A0A1I7TXR0_9PELO